VGVLDAALVRRDFDTTGIGGRCGGEHLRLADRFLFETLEDLVSVFGASAARLTDEA